MVQKGVPFVKPTDSCEGWKTNKQTNYDCITETPEKLAAFISHHTACPVAVFDRFPECTIDEDCAPRKCWLKWLQKEVTE